MALCQTHLKHLVHKNRSPAEVLGLLNEELFPRIRKDMFITLFLAVLDTKSEKVTYARVGHEPALLLKSQALKADQENVPVEELREMEWPWAFWNPSYSTSLFVMKLLIFRLVIYYAFTPMALPKHRIGKGRVWAF